MTKDALRARLRDSLEKAGSDWIFRYWGNDTDKNLNKLAAELDQFTREYQRRFGEKPDPMSLMEQNPLKGAAFFQIDTLLASVELKVMIWRILLGCEITKLECRYRAAQHFHLSFAIRSPYGGREESYESDDPSDFRVLRHVGLTGVGDQEYLQGYYAARGL